MHPFSYTRVSDTREALKAVRGGGRYIAGGTTLVDLMRETVERPREVVDISGLPLDEVTATERGGLRIGALVTMTEAAAHPKVRTQCRPARRQGPRRARDDRRRAGHRQRGLQRHRPPCARTADHRRGTSLTRAPVRCSHSVRQTSQPHTVCRAPGRRRTRPHRTAAHPTGPLALGRTHAEHRRRPDVRRRTRRPGAAHRSRNAALPHHRPHRSSRRPGRRRGAGRGRTREPPGRPPRPEQ
ncbi:FAD binding domain-containing protein [Streptomyces sp. NBC_00487]